ncbi:hypothetical protein C8Q77DRAFT_132559 [Trametes polyzona]|nr:hypothetical protein C8Q77DRAFT_132559 [Trametes polyzona]
MQCEEKRMPLATIPPINRLPAEVLVEIFTYLRPGSDVGNEDFDDEQHAWTVLRLACHYWDDIVRATPLFWGEVHVRTHPSWLALCLSRSQEAPLDITFYSDKYPIQDLEQLYRHATRIRKLVFKHLLVTPWALVVERLLALCVPSLETFELARGHILGSKSSFPCALRYPKLHSLYLSFSQMPSHPQLLPNLRQLTVKLAHTSQDLTIDRFLHALALCTGLESLRVEDSLDVLQGDWDKIPFRGQAIELLQLRSLELLDSDYNILALKAPFLDRLRLPRTSRVFLGNVLWDSLPTLTNLPSKLSSLLPPPPICDQVFPILKSITTVEVRIGSSRATYGITARTDEDKGPAPGKEPGVFNLMLDPWSDAYILDNVASDLMAIFGRSPLTRLRLHYTLPHSPAPDAAAWISVFRTFLTLKVLDVTDCEDKFGLWELLDAGLGDPDDVPSNDPLPTPLCPRLHTLVWHHSSSGRYGRPAPIGRMLRCLYRRARHGSRLRILDISGVGIYDGEHRTDWYAQLSDADRSLLHSVADSVLTPNW